RMRDRDQWARRRQSHLVWTALDRAVFGERERSSMKPLPPVPPQMSPDRLRRMIEKMDDDERAILDYLLSIAECLSEIEGGVRQMEHEVDGLQKLALAMAQG